MVGAEALDTDSPQFAARSETLIYRVKYRDSVELSKKINSPEVLIKTMADKNMLVIQALPEKIKEIKAKLARLDSPENPFQVKYDLFIVELKSGYISQLGFNKIDLNSDQSFNFISRDNIIEVAGRGMISFLQTQLNNTESIIKGVAKPSLVASINNKVSMNIRKETINTSDKNLNKNSEFELEITPENIDQTEREIYSKVNFNSSAFLKTQLTTTPKTKFSNPELIGAFSHNLSHNKDSTLEIAETREVRYFAMYLAARPVGMLPAKGRTTFDIGGFNNILNQEEPSESAKSKIDILYNSGLNISLEDYDSKKKRDFIFDFRKENTNNSDSIKTGIDFYLIEDLKFATYLQFRDEQNKLKIGLKDRVEVAPGLHLSAGYLPIYYDISNNKITDEKNWWFGTEMYFSKLLLDFRYNEYKAETTESSYRGLLGYQLWEPAYIVIGLEGNRDNEREYLGGIRLRTW
jgi:hypothetical protein